MSCEKPLLAYRYYRSDLGKSFISFKTHMDDSIESLENKYGVGNVFELPCGECDSCRKAYAKNWAIRLTLERPYWQYGYFLTLTYDDLCVNFGSYSDIQKFIKKLRYYLGDLSYFGAVERGEVTNRLHYHLIVMTNKPIDLEKPKLLKGKLHYHSQLIKKCWQYGDIHDITEFSYYCGAYVAKYCTKQGSCFMSQSIGKRYFLEHYQDIVNNKFIIYGNFGNEDHVFCPKFLATWFRELDDLEIQDFQDIKSNLMRTIQNERMRFEGNACRDSLHINYNKATVRKRGDF